MDASPTADESGNLASGALKRTDAARGPAQCSNVCGVDAATAHDHFLLPVATYSNLKSALPADEPASGFESRSRPGDGTTATKDGQRATCGGRERPRDLSNELLRGRCDKFRWHGGDRRSAASPKDPPDHWRDEFCSLPKQGDEKTDHDREARKF